MSKLIGSHPGKTSRSPTRSALPRAWAAVATKKPGKLVAVLQGGSTAERLKAANLLAQQLALKVYRVDLRPFISRFIGETEKNLDRLFEIAEPGRTLLYFDEADPLFKSEVRTRSATQRSADSWVLYLNERLRSFPGTVLFASNHHSRNSKISPRLHPIVARLTSAS